MKTSELNSALAEHRLAELILAFPPGKLITIFDVSEMSAMTTRREAKIESIGPLEFQPHYQAATFGKYRFATVSYRTKKPKDRYHFVVNEDTLILPGWDLPFRSDTEGGGCSTGNGMLNIVAPTIGTLRAAVEANLNPWFTSKARVIYVVKQGFDNEETPVYPELQEQEA